MGARFVIETHVMDDHIDHLVVCRRGLGSMQVRTTQTYLVQSSWFLLGYQRPPPEISRVYSGDNRKGPDRTLMHLGTSLFAKV